MSLPKKAIEEDQALESAAESASERLAYHRWHWTLDESNPDRVALREYARAIGRDFRTVHGYANGYALFADADVSISMSEAIDRARMGAETEAATEAVATARDLSFTHTRQSRKTEVRRVREIARERAEKHGTTFEDEVAAVADSIVKVEKGGARITAKRQERIGLRYIEMERKLDSVKRTLIEAVNLAHDIEWGDEEQELVQATLGNIKALLGLIDVAFAGSPDVDWDSELAKLTEV